MRASGATCLLLIIFAVPIIVNSADLDFAVKLKQRDFLPAPAKAQTLAEESSLLLGKHVLVQFDRPLTDADRQSLAAGGMELISYIPNFTYTVNLEIEIDEAFATQHGLRWLGEIYPDDKLSPIITDLGIGDWARRGNDLVEFKIVLHDDENLDYWAQEFENRFNAEIVGLARSINTVELIVPELSYLQLSELDAVIWIEQAAPPPVELNNVARADTRAEELQAAPYNLTGAGVTVAEWDGGSVYAVHADMIGRVTLRDGAGTSNHATHVAGTILGDGTEQGGLYAGMAPQALLASYLWWLSISEMETEYYDAIKFMGAQVATNSWGYGSSINFAACEAVMGNYYTENITLDNIVRGSQSQPITICWSAGNSRSTSSTSCGSLGFTYGTIGALATAKNIITVGAMSSGSDAMTSFSSWGPTDDGRLKPDVCGPGCVLRSCANGGGYWNACGTSMSCPATAGTIALLQEALMNSGQPWPVLPSTIKGILINTAKDVGNTGPDYSFGHGKVDGLKAVDKIVIGEPSYVENQTTTGTVHIYDLTVPSGAERLKVTLVWSDPGGQGIAGKDLVNDLDLELVDPLASIELPWVLNPAVPADWAIKGVDRLNNVETVEIESPAPGLWKARVTGFNIPTGPQSYSLLFTPDSIYTPGNLAALAVFDVDDITQDPGDTVQVQFWVSNVGAETDSVDVHIEDDAGWLIVSATDSVIILSTWDSVAFAVSAVIPASALANEKTTITCSAVSKSDSLVVSQASVDVIAGAFYSMALVDILDDTVGSPASYPFLVIVNNMGNAYDRVVVTIDDDLGWDIEPPSKAQSIPPLTIDTLNFTINVPAEVTHLAVNNITINGPSDGGSGDTITFQLTVNNPFPPPALLTPANPTYSQDRLPTFTWSGIGDSYTLLLAIDFAMQNVVHEFFGIGDQTFTLPVSDSLPDGIYYWAVRQIIGPDSSSLQATSHKLVIDNVPPATVAPISPINGKYLPAKTFSFFYDFGSKTDQGGEKSSGLAPEFGRIQISQDSVFGGGITTYEPLPDFVYTIPDTIDEGRWYWQVELVDSAGNNSGYTSPATFVMDSETPLVPVQLLPVDNAGEGRDTILFHWSSPAPPAYEISPEFYRIQFSSDSLFFSIYYTQQAFSDSLKLPSSLFIENVQLYWRVKAQDSAGHSSLYQSDPFNFIYAIFLCGDISGDDSGPNILDLTYIVDFIFRGGPAPHPFVAGDVNCDSNTNILDLTYMVDFIFRGGPTACCL